MWLWLVHINVNQYCGATKFKNSLSSKGIWKRHFSILSKLEDCKWLCSSMQEPLQCLLLQSVVLWTGKSELALKCCFVVLHCPSLTNENPKYLMERNEIKRRKTTGWLAKENKKCCQERNWTEKGSKWGREMQEACSKGRTHRGEAFRAKQWKGYHAGRCTVRRAVVRLCKSSVCLHLCLGIH